MTQATTISHDERELDGIWFLSTFLYFGMGLDAPDNPFRVENVSYVPSGEDSGFSQVSVRLGNGDEWRIEVEKVA